MLHSFFTSHTTLPFLPSSSSPFSFFSLLIFILSSPLSSHSLIHLFILSINQSIHHPSTPPVSRPPCPPPPPQTALGGGVDTPLSPHTAVQSPLPLLITPPTAVLSLSLLINHTLPLDHSYSLSLSSLLFNNTLPSSLTHFTLCFSFSFSLC